MQFIEHDRNISILTFGASIQVHVKCKMTKRQNIIYIVLDMFTIYML